MADPRRDDDTEVTPAADLLERWAAHRGTPLPETTPALEPVDQVDHVDHGPEHEVDAVAAGRAVVESLALVEPTPPSTDQPVAAPAPPPTAQPTVQPTAAPAAGRSTDVVFAPRVLMRRVVGLLTLAALLATAYVAVLASAHHTTLRLGGVAVLGGLTLVLWAVRAGAPVTRLAIVSGQLEVRRGSRREVVDLASRYTRVNLIGRPGRWGWQVLIARVGQPPLVIDSSVVDPRAFTEALLEHRLDLATTTSGTTSRSAPSTGA